MSVIKRYSLIMQSLTVDFVGKTHRCDYSNESFTIKQYFRVVLCKILYKAVIITIMIMIMIIYGIYIALYPDARSAL